MIPRLNSYLLDEGGLSHVLRFLTFLQANLYSYKIKVQKKKKDFVVHQVYHFHGKFASIEHMTKILSEELNDDISAIGYF